MRVRFADFFLDAESRQLMRGATPVHLSPKAFNLLCELVRQRPNAVSKAELHDRIWPGTFVVDANLTVLLTEIRRALGDDPQTPRFIRTVPKFGYAFCGEVTEVSPAPSPGPAPKVGLLWRDRALSLSDGEHLIGRDPACAVWLDVSGVSRRHARVVVTGDRATIEDLGSKNGTFVGNVAVSGTRELRDGDVIQIGEAELRFRDWSRSLAVETDVLAKRS